MKNILQVCFSPDLGGLELHVKELCLYLGHKAVLSKRSKLTHAFEANKLDYFESSRLNPFALAKIIDENDIDVVHFHWVKDASTIVLAKLISNKKPKIVLTRHNRITRFKSDFYHRFLYKNIDLIIAVSKKVEELLHKYIPEVVAPKFVTCYIGADDPKLLNDEQKTQLKAKYNLKDEFIVCIVGRIERAKGQHIVLEAVEKLIQNGVNAKCLVVGAYMDKAYFDSLQRFSCGVFTGFHPSPTDFMQISDCVVSATKEETFGLTLIEAMKCGVCTLGSNAGGPTEIIENGVSGLLFKSFDSDDLYEKLYKLYKNQELLIEFASNGKIRGDEMFDAKRQFGKLNKVLENA